MALTSDQQTQLQGIKEKALNLKGVIDERVRNERAGRSSGGGSGGITSDSGDATNSERTVSRDIKDITNRAGIGDEPDTSGLEDLQKAQQKEIERQRALLETRRSNAVAGITEGFGVEKEATEFQQKRETGQTSVDLARAGGYLGVTASQQGVLQNLVISQRSELRALESAKQDAITKANNAYEDRDFELAQESLKSAREIESEIFNRKNVFFGQQMDILGEERSQIQMQRDQEKTLYGQANDRIDRVLEAGIVPEMEEIQNIARGLNVSVDEADKIIRAGLAAKELEIKDKKTDRELAVLNTLRGIPRDQSVVIDGVTYRGLASLPASSGGGGTATEREAARKIQVKAEFMDDLIGTYGGREDNERITMPIEEAIKLYPELDVDYIQEVFEALENADNKQVTAQKIAAGEWDVQTVDYPGDNAGPQKVVYDKKAFEEAIKTWSTETTGFFGGVTGKNSQADTVVIDGVSYTGAGVWDAELKRYVAPFSPEDFEVNN